ncbi:hypothetical protein QAD02_018610 [Eretmocerus hayati]|uniref:Uncharacterized protein n=1 Tax=Eretmocerus hayati TaxID=131215 RepID=A0ACC2PIA2_9HYME|nr:hypothetical protein QAD02_018610 [Eretmocerus hayati]
MQSQLPKVGPPDDWRNTAFRESMILKIEEHIQQTQAHMSKSATELENHVFTRVKSKEEYFQYMNKLLAFIQSNARSKGVTGPMGAKNINAVQKSMTDSIGAQLPQQGENINSNMWVPGPNQGQQNIGQPVGSSGNIASNLLQTLNQRPGQTMNIQQAIHNKMSGINVLQNQQMGMNQMNQMQNMQGNPMMSQMNQMNQGNMSQQMAMQANQQQQQQISGPQMGPNQMQQAVQNQMQNQMVNHQMGGPMNPALQSQSSPSQQQQQQQHMNQMNAMQMNVNQMTQQQLSHLQRKPVEIMNSGYPGPRNMTPNQFLGQSPSPSVPSPGGLAAPGSNQMVSSPALVPSPNPHAMLGGPRSMGMAPSPSSSLNTPAGMIGGAVPSPVQDEQVSQACKEKIQKLRKWIDPLNRMILKLTNEGYTEKTSKMKRLLELLTNPSSATKLDVLQKCEVVLERMDLKKYEASAGPAIPSNLKEHQFLNPLLEVVCDLLRGPIPNHTLQRTFGPCVEAMFGPEIRNIPPPLKKQKTEEVPSEIPDVLQGEIARLDQRFKLNLDPAHQSGSKCIQLICSLDDKHLPCVPPILVTVPIDYPDVPPKCVLASHEYTTPYLSAVQRALNARLAKLPRRFSISQLLDTWEMSVRQACSPKARSEEVDLPDKPTSGSTSVQTPTVTSTVNPVNNGISTNLVSSAAT